MDKLGDIELFVSVVKQKGLASAGRKLNLSPASVTAKLNRLEESYGVRLLTRTTRKVALTEEGATFYKHCLKILDEVHQADESLNNLGKSLKGHLKITATIDFGKQVVAPTLAKFTNRHPRVSAHLNLVDSVVNLVENEYDLAIRFGGLTDNRMVARLICPNHRVLFAAPSYIQKYGEPATPEDLKNHHCLGMEREDLSLNTWHFEHQGMRTTMEVSPRLTSNDGSMLRDWAIAGEGIVLKSWLDIRDDVKKGRLVTLLDDFKPDYFSDRIQGSSDLYAIYPSREYLPNRVREFILFLQQELNPEN
ncbi:MAG: LysR family transcriptional regulator [Gammaproteobacteria bacterium]|nr:LysR family transcriptional regulator [Gammaproteobacteria bacterium]